MYIIIKFDFDNMENRNPERSKIIGYVEDEISAQKWIDKTMKNISQYRGWDGELYPYFEKKYIEKLL